MKRKLLNVLLSAVIVMGGAVMCEAAEGASAETFAIAVNGETFSSEAGAYVDEQGEVMVSASLAASLFGLSEDAVSTNEEGGESFQVNDVTVTFTAGQNSISIEDGSELTRYMYTKSVPVEEDEFYFPVHYLAAAANKNCAWNEEVFEITDRESEAADATIYLTRHGKTLFNTVERVQGWCDTPLTDAGVVVAENLGKGLAAEGVTFVAAYSSDLGRQRQTAHIVLDELGLDLPLTELFGLRETFYGDWEGEKESVRNDLFCEMAGVETVYELYEMGSLMNELCIETDESGMAETDQEVFERMLDALETIAQENRDANSGNVLAVTSGGATITMIQKFGAPGQGISNAAVTYLDCVDGVLILGAIGDTHFSDMFAEE